MIHELKIVTQYFNAVVSGEKTFEVRKNDRGFQKGDLLALNEIDEKTKFYTGNSCLVYIDYILDGPDYCKDGYVIMSIKPCEVVRAGSALNKFLGREDYSVPLATKGA